MQDSVAKEKKWGEKMSGNFAIKGGGRVGRLMANAILNFHFDFLNPSLTQTARQKYSTYFFYWWPSTPICTQILTEQQLQMREVHLTLITDDPWFMDHKGKAVLGRFHLAVTSGYLTTGIHQICTTLQIQDQQSGIIFRRIVNLA